MTSSNKRVCWFLGTVGAVWAATAILSAASLKTSAAPESAPASHSSSKVHIGETGQLRSKNTDLVWVYISADGMSNAVSLSRAGANYNTAIRPLVACVVSNGTKVENITGQISSAFFSGADHHVDVMVLTGPNAGCRGVTFESVLLPG